MELFFLLYDKTAVPKWRLYKGLEERTCTKKKCNVLVVLGPGCDWFRFPRVSGYGVSSSRLLCVLTHVCVYMINACNSAHIKRRASMAVACVCLSGELEAQWE